MRLPLYPKRRYSKGFRNFGTVAAGFAFSAHHAFPIQRAIKFRSDGRIEMFDPLQFEIRSQDLPNAYHDAGQFYWGTQEAWLSNVPIFGSNSVPVVLPRYRVQDIDTPEDWIVAEQIFKSSHSSYSRR